MSVCEYSFMLVFCRLTVQWETGESVRDHIDRFSKSVHTALCVLCFVSMTLHGIDQMSHCLDGSTFIRGNERATIKVHPATPHLPRPYGKGIPPEG